PRSKSRASYRKIQWELFSTYRKIFTAIFVGNLAALLSRLCIHILSPDVPETRGNYLSTEVATAVSANLMLAILARHEHVINALFRISTSLPITAPLWLRKRVAKIYSYGGIHSGCAVASTVWFTLYLILLSYEYASNQHDDAVLVALSAVILLLLLAILILAYPRLRVKYHDHFEAVHRFAGWTVLALFWAQVCGAANAKSRVIGAPLGLTLAKTPSMWFLTVATLCVIYPWTRLRLRKVEAEPLSDHAVRLHFDYGRFGLCSGMRLTDSPLKETHSFATIPREDGEPGYSVVISNAGDWTKKIIRNPPTKMYTRGYPVIGVLRVASLFSPVIIVATGSGIGPCMSFFVGNPGHDIRVLWSTRAPEKTYGRPIVDSVLNADPQAVIIDTDKQGRPDLVAETYKLYKAAQAEAIVIISNPRLTSQVCFEMESRGVPAYGPIFDS
ncbi:hypothetical protein K490DRAFT_23654, partial [Saccharata proteae CBS 121410]